MSSSDVCDPPSARDRGQRARARSRVLYPKMAIESQERILDESFGSHQSLALVLWSKQYSKLVDTKIAIERLIALRS